MHFFSTDKDMTLQKLIQSTHFFESDILNELHLKKLESVRKKLDHFKKTIPLGIK